MDGPLSAKTPMLSSLSGRSGTDRRNSYIIVAKRAEQHKLSLRSRRLLNLPCNNPLLRHGQQVVRQPVQHQTRREE